ncbi:response regulator transcription factor [Anaerolineae bacterium CFX7]|nr:response regulator transcription factor [Anaerolineae bacterium CFX7]
MERIPIVIADDHLQVRTQIMARLSRETDFAIVGLADNSAATVACASATHPRIVLIDPMMGDGMGLDAIRQVRSNVPDAAIIVLTAFTDTAQKIELEKLGVRSILNKGIESHRLVEEIHRAARYANHKH